MRLSLTGSVEQTEAPQALLPVALPRVNLLPPEIEQRRRFRRVQTGLGGAVLAAVGLVALLYVSAVGSVEDAQTELDAAGATGSQLRAQSAQFADVTETYARAAAAQQVLRQAMGEEVRWSRYLNDLSLTVPDGVWLKNVTFTQAPVAGPAGGTEPGIGTATFTGVGFDHDDVAVWLESLAEQKGYANPYFSASTEALLGTRKVVDFTSTTTVTSAALSGRYTAPAGG